MAGARPFLIALSVIAIACADARPSTGPGPVLSPPPAQSFAAIAVAVHDALSRIVPGVTVVVVDGPSAGASAITDAHGRATIAGKFDALSRVTLRATRDDFAGTVTVVPQTRVGAPEPYAVSEIVGIPVRAAANVELNPGAYTATIAFDGECAIPVDVRARSYDATVSGAAPYYEVALDGQFRHLFPDAAGRFTLAVAGREIGLYGDDQWGGLLFEHIAPNAMLSLNFWGVATPDTLKPLSLTIPTLSVVIYCETNPGTIGETQCMHAPRESVARRDECRSNGRLTLTRR